MCQGELEHCRVKHFYAQTNKIKFMQGITRQQYWERLLHKLQAIEQYGHHDSPKDDNSPFLHFVDQDLLLRSLAGDHYQISASQQYHWNLFTWCRRNQDDPTVKVWLRCCRNDWILMLSTEFHTETQEPSPLMIDG